MSRRTVALSDLLGRAVRDADGRKIGRIEELNAEISLEHGGSEYVVTSFSVGSFPPFDAIATGNFVQQFARRVRQMSGYRRYEIPWDWMDLSDPAQPRVLRREGELPISSCRTLDASAPASSHGRAHRQPEGEA